MRGSPRDSFLEATVDTLISMVMDVFFVSIGSLTYLSCNSSEHELPMFYRY